MVRINLLPPEILERRKYEVFYPYVFIAGGILLLVVAGTWLTLQLVVGSRADALQAILESTQQVREQAEALSVFELRETEFAGRQEAASKALEGRVEIGGIAESLSLILPEEVWIESISLHQDSGLRITADTPNNDDRSMAEGYKSVVATLVRLASVGDLHDVWLAGARTSIYSHMGSSDSTVPVIAFEATARIKKPVDEPADAVAGK